MNKSLLLFSALLIFQSMHAQSKKELQADLNQLRSELAQKDEELRAARNNERISVANAEQFEAQVAELQAANATLLSNLKVFTEASQQRSESIGATLESLRDKEAKLKVIDDEFSKNDSIALLVLTGFKQTLGEEARVGVQRAAVAVELDVNVMFGSSLENSVLSEEGQVFLDKIAAVLRANPDTNATLVIEQDTIYESPVYRDRGIAMYKSLSESTKDETGRINVTNFKSAKESYKIRIHPRLNEFYMRVRETLK